MMNQKEYLDGMSVSKYVHRLTVMLHLCHMGITTRTKRWRRMSWGPQICFDLKLISLELKLSFHLFSLHIRPDVGYTLNRPPVYHSLKKKKKRTHSLTHSQACIHNDG